MLTAVSVDIGPRPQSRKVTHHACTAHEEFVSLTNDEIDVCARHGVRMWQLSRDRGHDHHKGPRYKSDGQTEIGWHARGAVAEGAICKALGIEIELHSESYNVPDVLEKVQVRQLGADHYGVRVYGTDDPSWAVVGVVIELGQERVMPYRIPGWIYAADAMAMTECLMDPGNRGKPMWAIPQCRLRPLRELKRIVQ